MDPLHFSIKRIYWSGHARIRELIIPLGITPARADALRVVTMHAQGIGQAMLTQLLGVSPPTTSKMLKAMEEKGWIERFSVPRGGGNIVHATRSGFVLIAQVIQRFVLSGAIPLRMAVAWGHGLAAKKLRGTLYRLLNRARRALLDRAPFLHPWRNEPTYVRRTYTFWEARLRADDVDDTVSEDIESIRKRAKEPIACTPPPRTSWELRNISAQQRHDEAPTPTTSAHPADEGLEAVAPAAPAPPPATAVDGAPATAVTTPNDDVPPELAQLWKNLVELGGGGGLSAEDVPKWGETE